MQRLPLVIIVRSILFNVLFYLNLVVLLFVADDHREVEGVIVRAEVLQSVDDPTADFPAEGAGFHRW